MIFIIWDTIRAIVTQFVWSHQVYLFLSHTFTVTQRHEIELCEDMKEFILEEEHNRHRGRERKRFYMQTKEGKHWKGFKIE